MKSTIASPPSVIGSGGGPPPEAMPLRPPDAVLPGVPHLSTRVVARAVDVAVVTAGLLLAGRWMGFGYDWFVLGLLLTLGYFAGLSAAFGRTLGKRIMGLRLVGPTGENPTLRQASVREAFMLVGAVPFVGPLLSVACWTWLALSIRSHPLGQGRHDLLAGGTRVVRHAADRGDGELSETDRT
jgi:uncharacterized RDD family membrane protein YckC